MQESGGEDAGSRAGGPRRLNADSPTGQRAEKGCGNSETTLAAGFRVREEGGVLTVEGPYPPPGWMPRMAGDLVHVPFPGTPVHYDGRFFEIVEEEALGRGQAVRFRLEAWNDREVMRAPSELNASVCRDWAADRRRAIARQRQAQRLVFLMPFLGMMPEAYQRGIERDVGLSASRMTLWSAVLVGALTAPAAMIGLLAFLIPGFAASYPELSWAESWVWPLSYFAVESWIRAHLAFTNDEALGSMPVVLMTGVWRLIRDRGGPKARRP